MGNRRYRTVHCGYCYESGHNSRTCQSKTQNLQYRFDQQQNAVKDAEAKDLPLERYERARSNVDHLAKQLIQRTNVDPRTGQLAQRVSNRRCSFCKWKYGEYSEVGKGHTRRTCSELKADQEEARLINIEYRKIVLDGLRNAGLGVGSLIKMNVRGYHPDPNNSGKPIWGIRERVMLLNKVDWDRINYKNPYTSGFIAQEIQFLGTREGRQEIPLPYFPNKESGSLAGIDGEGVVADFEGGTASVIGTWHTDPELAAQSDSSWQSDRNPKLAGSVSAEYINPPATWHEGRSTLIDDWFNDRKG